ncbi:peptide chain release factor N(5)-glutamine methyltransferase [Enterococcus songbeiensis]|uniref:peptide chain release factor N(5)-glutamine methyltransferase n=1 Tax=Enterococcus songbeiensis TaxID=2559927 RepID=UPI0010F7A38C|nr:peptide chain release factor N(5)-glutamine methyltransferase [Enterococcus songbeiensis]
MVKKTYREVLNRASSFLESQGKEGYAIQFLFLERKKWTKMDWLLAMNQTIPTEEEELIQQDLTALLANHPPHYLLGYADFYGHRFKVTPATLIPRPETEELVAECLKESGKEKQLVVDVGTGTGAIAISLKLACPDWQMIAVDLSPEALTVAKENATNLGAVIDFRLGDTLAPVEEKIDILISNPPYISTEEWGLMDESVRTFEPKMALFAEENGLALYQKIAAEGKKKLHPEGKIFLEIGFQQGPAVKKIFEKAFPEKKVKILQDMSGKDRMIFVS